MAIEKISEKEIKEFMETVRFYEGEDLTFEEAKLTYAARKKLTATAFCGPDRTYPAHDAARVRNAFVRLSTFGRRLSEGLRKRIHACLMRKAKRFGVEHGGCWICGKEKAEETLGWYEKKHPEVFGVKE